MKKILILLISIFTCVNCFSQQPDSSSKEDLIYLNGFGWKKGDTKLKSFALRKEIFQTPQAIPYLKKERLKIFTSGAFFFGGLLFTIAAIGNEGGYYYTREHRRISYTVISSASFIASAVIFRFALKDIGRAVHLRNLDILKQ